MGERQEAWEGRVGAIRDKAGNKGVLAFIM